MRVPVRIGLAVLAAMVGAVGAGDAWGEEMRAQLNVPYAEPATPRRSLDVYAPATGSGHPIVVWIHGGGWRRGDKASARSKAQVMVDRGYVLAAVNYRFVPDVTVAEMTGDVAQAIGWLRAHAADYGADANRIIVMGHSAGAHLAALVCTDTRYLKDAGVPMTAIRGCVPIDVSVYDLPKRLQDGGDVTPELFKSIFGADEAAQRAVSPVAHVAADQGIPPFLILHVAERPETRSQSHWFADHLRKAGVAAEVVAGEGKTHTSINRDLGLPDDPPTQAVWKFFDRVLQAGDAKAG